MSTTQLTDENPILGRCLRVVGLVRVGRRRFEKVWAFPASDLFAAHRFAFHFVRHKLKHDVYMGLMAERTGGIWWGPQLNPDRSKAKKGR